MNGAMQSSLATSCIFLLVTWSSITWETHRGAERPLQSIILVLFLSGAILLFASKSSIITQSILGRDQRSLAVDNNGDKHDWRNISSRRSSSRFLFWQQTLDRHARLTLLKLIVACIILRVGTLCLIAQAIQCSKNSIEVLLLPCLILIYGLFTGQRLLGNNDNADADTDAWSRNIYTHICHSFSRSLARYVLPTLLLCFGIYQTSMQTLQSTYICSSTIRAQSSVYIFQITGTVLDSLIIVVTWRILENDQDNKRKLVTLGIITTSAGIILATLGIANSLWTWGGLRFLFQLPINYVWSVIRDSMVCAGVLLCVIYLHSQTQPLSLVFNITCCVVSVPLLTTAWSSRSSFPPQSNSAKSNGLLLLFVGHILSRNSYSSSRAAKTSPRLLGYGSSVLALVLTILFITAEVFFLIRSNYVETHPLYNLMYEARIEGDRWLKAASPSASLQRAVLEYKSRHRGRDPPPNFDKWYAYAMQKTSLIIDNYDSIDRDLLPFWSIEPAEIRKLVPSSGNSTQSMDSIVSITIRKGEAATNTVEALDNKEVAKILAMINEFATWLPDLEIGINLRRQPRVSLPWGKIEPMRKLGASRMNQKQLRKKNLGFSEPTKEKWPSRHQKIGGSPKNMFRPWGSRAPSIFDEKVAPSCSYFSQARRNRGWNFQDFCSTCAAPQSDGPFIKNWTVAADLCHQPDMANLHGFFVGEDIASPDEPPKGKLIPVFSRSKVTGYNDILFPFPGDYIDTDTPDLSDNGFYEKADKLFWRGGLSSEGISFHGQWQGMQQQRLVHLSNNFSSMKLVPILCPSTEEGKFVYENVPASDLKPMLEKMDIGFTNNLPCLSADCHEQVREFGIRESIEFSEHNNYRYLFSLDQYGGSSSNLIPFLQSKSVPFHASIFRSWYDDRLTPWLHFVPQDGRLHDVHSTLAYFTGFQGRLKGREVQMNGKPAEAAFIADQGRKWARSALRSQDASVYAFRLLLEYARVVDDRRNELGYVGKTS